MRLVDLLLLTFYLIVTVLVAVTLVVMAEVVGFVPTVAFCIAFVVGVLLYDLGGRHLEDDE